MEDSIIADWPKDCCSGRHLRNWPGGRPKRGGLRCGSLYWIEQRRETDVGAVFLSKTAQLAVSRGLAEFCAGTGVTMNAILPGPTRSAGVEQFVSQVSGGQPFADFEKGVFQDGAPQFPDQTL
jgi:NAD(P)-dependent dehydrogenase (short-subunit alcohol dehydrogenase family)